MSPEMSTKCTTLGKTFVANFAFVWFLTGMRSSMFNQVLSGAECFTAKFTNFRFLTSMYPNVSLHILSSDQFAAHFARHLAFTSMSPHMLLVTITVKRFEVADLALVLLPRLGLTMNLHMTTQINSIAERFVADLANAGLLFGMYAHVSLQGRLQVETLVANFTKFCEFLIMSSNMDLQVIF